MGAFKGMTIVNRGLRYKLMVAFSLMSIIPLLACMYVIFPHLFPDSKQLIHISLIILFSIIISILGLLLAKSLIDPVIDMAIEAKIIASGEYGRKIAVSSDDEIGNLGQSINVMTQKIKANLEELKSYGQRMREINVDIHKKVLALSSLLQIGDMIATGNIKLESLLELAVDRVSLVFDSGFGILYMPRSEGKDFISKTASNMNKERLDELVIRSGGRGIMERALEENSILIIDNTLKMTKELEAFVATYGIKNLLALPICSGNKKLGLLVVGNSLDDFRFKTDDIDLVKVFAKQITIAIENDILNRKAEELAIKDNLTELYNKNFILARLEEEIRRSIFYQRPCSFIAFGVNDFKAFREVQGELAAEEALKRVAGVLKDNTGPVGKAARIGGDEFALLLPEKNKKQATHIADEIRKKIESASISSEKKLNLTVSCGVGENPIDGATADELFKKALDDIGEARASGKNKVAA